MQPFRDFEHGYSQRLSSDELASGAFALNMSFLRAFRAAGATASEAIITIQGGGQVAVQLDLVAASCSGGSSLQSFYARGGFQPGSEVTVRFTNEGTIVLSPNVDSSISRTLQPKPQDRDRTTEMKALNKILYGPPGTGKTFRTAKIAVEICDGSAPASRAELMRRYEDLQREGRIRFVTFHQSYSYEDFVEGLRPEITNGHITYRIRQGIFREACEAARRSLLVKPGLTGKPLEERTFYKMSLGRAGTVEGNAQFEDCIQKGEIQLGWGEDIDFTDCKSPDDIRATVLRERPDIVKPDSQAQFIRIFMLDMQVGDIVIASYGNSAFQAVGEVTGEYEFKEAGTAHQTRSVRWLAVFGGGRPLAEIYARAFVQRTLHQIQNSDLKFAALQTLLDQQSGAVAQSFVLIIDEINRASISKVFGELITLIEDDKREGSTNAIKVKLPYSGDELTVPANLYLVGTMNTADRSIALLDTALRRRFDFEELQPEPELLEAIGNGQLDLAALLSRMNERIEYLYDRDHKIGHAYLIHVKTLPQLDAVFRRKIIPLLQEYFYEDLSKVRQVLNDYTGGFIDVLSTAPMGLAEFGSQEAEPRYQVRAGTFSIESYLKIYQ
jgi:5-methylcytosine-specific restriction protein B